MKRGVRIPKYILKTRFKNEVYCTDMAVCNVIMMMAMLVMIMIMMMAMLVMIMIMMTTTTTRL